MTVGCLVALVVAGARIQGQQRNAPRPLSSAELRRILANQPDFTADAFRSSDGQPEERRIGRIALRGDLYRVEPDAKLFDRRIGSSADLLRPGAFGVVRFSPTIASTTALIIQTAERRYYEISPNDSDFMTVYFLTVMHPHSLLLHSLADAPSKHEFEDLGEETIDGHQCRKIALVSESSANRTVFFAARDLKNLVIRIDWANSEITNIPGMFPDGGVTILRNVKLEASAKLFAVPPGFAKVDRARELAEQKAVRQEKLRSSFGAPRFKGATVSPPIVRPGAFTRISASFDLVSDEIELTFKWRADAGRIIGSGSEVELDATGLSEGEVGVTFEVSDNYGHAPFVGRVLVKVRDEAHDLDEVQTAFPAARFDRVLCAASDNAGGWFVAGAPSAPVSPGASSIVHLLPNSTLDGRFAADSQLGDVGGIAVGSGGLYVSKLLGPSVVALDPTTGARLGWNVSADATGMIATIALAGKTLYIGGEFYSVGGVPRRNLAAIDTTTGKVLPWNPAPDGIVRSLVVAGDRLFVSGFFSSIAGRQQSSLVSFDTKSGRLLDFEASMDPSPSAISVDGNVVYYASADRVGALDAETGRPLRWNPRIKGTVWSMAATPTTVYLAGDFSTVTGRTRVRLAAVDTKSAEATEWDPEADDRLMVILAQGERVFVGGNFKTVGRQRRSKFAVLDSTTGRALPGAQP